MFKLSNFVLIEDTELNSNFGFEFGSNANGYYKKYTNGLLEQWGNKQAGNLVNPNVLSAGVALPIAYMDTNYTVMLSKEAMGNQADTVGASANIDSKSKGAFVIYVQRENGTLKQGYSTLCGWYCIGRWK